jgi:hypothetical protein
VDHVELATVIQPRSRADICGGRVHAEARHALRLPAPPWLADDELWRLPTGAVKGTIDR